MTLKFICIINYFMQKSNEFQSTIINKKRLPFIKDNRCKICLLRCYKFNVIFANNLLPLKPI